MKKITLKDISNKVGVSTTTVSMVLNRKPELRVSDEIRHKVLTVAEELGYKKNTKVSVERSNLIGLIVPTLSNPYFMQLVASVEKHARSMGYHMIVCNTERKKENELMFIKSLIKHKVDGIISSLTPSKPSYIEISNNIPIIILGETNNNNHIATVGLDSYKSGEIVAAHLYALGHRSIAYLTSPIKNISVSRVKRLEGLQNYYKEKGIDNSIHLYEGKDEFEGQEAYEIELGNILTRRMLLDKKDITAIVTVSDLMAPGIFHTLEEFGLRVPYDMSVVGFDNSIISKFLKPKLTTIEHFIDVRSKLAIEQIISMINGFQENEILTYSVEYTPKLIIRDSTGRKKESLYDKEEN